MKMILCSFLFIFGLSLFLAYHQFKNSLENSLKADKVNTEIISALLSERTKAATEILNSYSSRQPFIKSVKSKSIAGVVTHLADLKKKVLQEILWVISSFSHSSPYPPPSSTGVES